MTFMPYLKSSEAIWWFCVTNRLKHKLIVSSTEESIGFEWHDDNRIIIFWLNYLFRMASMSVFMCLRVFLSDNESPYCKRHCSKDWRRSDVWTVTGLYKRLTGVWVCRLDFGLGRRSALSVCVCVWRGDWLRALATRLRQTAVYLSEGPALPLQHFFNRVPNPTQRQTAHTGLRRMSSGSLCLLFDLLIQTLAPQSAQSG